MPSSAGRVQIRRGLFGGIAGGLIVGLPSKCVQLLRSPGRFCQHYRPGNAFRVNGIHRAVIIEQLVSAIMRG